MDEPFYEQTLAFVQNWGTVYFVAVFTAACVYALWPSNKERFKAAARIPLEDEGEDP